MKIRNKILFISVATMLFLLGSCYYYKYKQTIIEQIAKEAFVKAVDAEAYKRTPNTDVSVSFTGRKLLKKDEAPKSITWYNESGKRKYKIDPEKHWKNITMDSSERLVHSTIFEEYPLDLDSLNYCWQNLLQEEKVICRTGIHIYLTDLDEKTTSFLTSNNEWYQNLEPFWVCTIGYRCEIECFLYSQCSLWQVLGLMGIVYILLYILIIFTVYKVAVIIRRKMNPETIIIEKSVLVKEVEFTAARLYHLGGDVYFDAEKRIMSEGEKSVYLTNLPAELLELFLQEDNHILSVNAIGEALWGIDGNYENRVYQVISRLRDFLKQFPSLSIDRESIGNYQLKINEI